MVEAVQDATTMGEILVAEDVKADLEAKEVVQLQEEIAEEMVVSEVTEDHQEKKEVLGVKEAVLQEEKELQEELKALEILQDQEDQEEVNDFR